MLFQSRVLDSCEIPSETRGSKALKPQNVSLNAQPTTLIPNPMPSKIEADMSGEEAEALATKPLGHVAASHLVEATLLCLGVSGFKVYGFSVWV